jgi:cell wall-associated NlpC family hydrolase
VAGVSGAGLALATAGGVLLWSGLADLTPITLVKDLSAGKALPPIRIGSPLKLLEEAIGSAFSSALGAVNPFDPNSPLGAGVGAGLGALFSSDPTASALGNAIAQAALRGEGVPYKWGKATPAGWDCSGFVTYVLHHDMGLNLPDNNHTVTMQFLTWSGAVTIPKQNAAAGDLICWPTHVAIAISNTQCIGAETYGVGTVIGPFNRMGPGGETYVVRRVKAQPGAAAAINAGGVAA